MDNKNEIFKENPFKVEGLKRVSRNLKNGTQVVADTKTGELFEMTKVSELTTIIDESPYTKMYHRYAGIIKNLNVPALRLFVYIIINIGIKKDYVFLQRKTCLEFAGYNEKSKKSYYSALQELIDLGVIAESTVDNKYWVNPNVLFNGSRVDLFKENINFDED